MIRQNATQMMIVKEIWFVMLVFVKREYRTVDLVWVRVIAQGILPVSMAHARRAMAKVMLVILENVPRHCYVFMASVRMTPQQEKKMKARTHQQKCLKVLFDD